MPMPGDLQLRSDHGSQHTGGTGYSPCTGRGLDHTPSASGISWGIEELPLREPGTSPIAPRRARRRLNPQAVGELHERPAAAALAAQSSGITTIVVDDSPRALRVMCSVVARQRNLSLVGAATNGRDAVALARRLRPDLVLLDLEMPVMDGVEAASRLNRECPATKVVMVTVHDTPALRTLCCERGAHAFIAKDALKDELPVVVPKLLGGA